MKHRTVGMMALALVACLAARAAEVPEVTPKVTDVTVFKDGHALVMARGAVTLTDGWCRSREVPVPVLGTFWGFVADDKARVEFLRAGFVETTETKPCMSIDDIVQVNIGRKVAVVEQPKDAPPVTHTGILRGVLKHKGEHETQVGRNVPGGRDRWGRYRGNTSVQETKETAFEAVSSFVMLESEVGMQLIQRSHIRSILIEGKDPVTTIGAPKKVREIAMHIARDGRPLRGRHEVGMVYLQKGIRWIPNYHIELLDDGKARLSLQGTLINDLVDLENANVGLVVGVPSFVMKGNISPVALRDVGLHLSTYFQPPSPQGTGGQQALYLSNAIMSQAAMPAAPVAGAARGGPDIPAEGQQEDLFLYRKSRITLKKGERAVVHLMDVDVSYEDIYVWEIPAVPPKELWRHVGRNEQQNLLRSLTGLRAMHKVRIKNTGNAPWTTGPAAIFKNGTPLGQQLLTYTSIKNEVDVPITIATDVNTSKKEREVERKHNALRVSSTSYSKISMHGTLSVTNFKDREVRVIVKRQIIGSATKATHDGAISLANSTEDALGDLQGYPWYWWSWPWWWLGLNPYSEVAWDITLAKGKSVTLEYDYFYYHHP